MSEDIAAFIAACYDEAEALARAVFSAAELFSKAPQRSPSLGHQVFDGSGIVITHDRSVVLPSDVATFIAANDPAHRLRDIALKRAILAEHREVYRDCRQCGRAYPCVTVRQLGTEFSDHPEYRKKWAP